MLRVTIELLPGGNTFRKKVLGVVDIANVSGLADVSDYLVTFGKVALELRDHRRADGWLPLVARAFADLLLVQMASSSPRPLEIRETPALKIPPRVEYVHELGGLVGNAAHSRCGRHMVARPEADTDPRLSTGDAVTCPACRGGGA